MLKTLKRGVACCALVALLPAASLAQEGAQADVSKLEEKVASLEAKVEALEGLQEEGQAEVDESFDEIDQQMFDLSKLMAVLKPGKRKFLITGYATGGFENVEGEDSTFSGEFAPIFLWQLNENMFFEAEVEFELEDNETAVGLEYAQMSYVLSDFATLGLGKFLNPANPFAERLHPAWINKLPDAPLGLGPMRVMSFAQLGAQVHGGVPVGNQKITYAVYVSNGSTLEEGAANYGTLSDDNYTDLNNNKAVGGRLGYFPLPELEFGYSMEFSQATASGSEVADADVTIQSVDLNYVATVGKGTLDVRAQWAFSDTDNVVYDPNGTGSYGPQTLKNKRNGGYLQAAFRPADMGSELLNNLEGVLRYDEVDLPSGAPEGSDESRVTVGLNYWTSASTVFKAAYQMADSSAAGGDYDAVLFQWATGF